MPKRTDIETILIIGSGPIVIGQASEFDYSGTQACRLLRAEGYRVILVNSNPATIMTDPDFADRTYVEPLDVAPEATGEHGLVIVTLRSLRAGALLGVTSRALSRKRQVSGHGKVVYRAEQQTVTIVGERPVPHQVDGDYLGEADRLEVTHHPDSLLLLAPPAP